ncbi:MAG: hypothetical protein QM704_02580 [Anaeromyxobacteraceae bacterium]
MTVERETLFRCTFSSPVRTTTAHLAAWDAGEAVQLFSEELRGEGVGERGSIEVAALSGNEKKRAAFKPAPRLRRRSAAATLGAYGAGRH